MRNLRSLAVVLVMLGRATLVHGQNAQSASNVGAFAHLRSGDCTIRVELPADSNFGTAILLRNENATLAHPRFKGVTGTMRSVEFRLQQPPILGEQFAVSLNGTTALSAVVKDVGPHRLTCAPKDDRGLFEPTFLIGVSADAFAPNDHENYPPNTDYSLKTSSILRVDGQLRLGDNTGGWLDHLWLEGSIKYGVRSTDLDCANADKKSPLCDRNSSAFTQSDNTGQAITANVLRASKIEAIFRPRYEFYTLHPDSDVPIVLYMTGRFGFGQAPDEVKVENIYSGGPGFVIPAGPFRDTGFEATVGVDRGYRTNPGGTRIRQDFRLVVGPSPSFLDQLPFLSRLGQSVRYLVEVVVDRNPFGRGPDSTQTFLGVVLDGRALLP